jgi:hypothetical protein
VFEDVSLQLPAGKFGCRKIMAGQIPVKNLKGKFDRDYKGEITFVLAGGDGIVNFNFDDTRHSPFFSFDYKLNSLNLGALVNSLNREIEMSGIIDIAGDGTYKTGEDMDMTVEFNSVKRRGVGQYMNFSAVQVISALGGGNPVKTMGSANFNYSKIAGRITLKENYITLQGLAGESRGQQYLIRGGIFGTGMNLMIDEKSNTIKLQELIDRVKNAVDRISRGKNVNLDVGS